MTNDNPYTQSQLNAINDLLKDVNRPTRLRINPNTLWQAFHITHPDVWQEMQSNFWKVQFEHVERVQRNLMLFAKDNEGNSALHAQILLRHATHDNSKTKEPEYTPYVWRYWRTKCRADGMQPPFDTIFQDETLDQAIRDAVFHHVTHNRHHPEWHPDPDEMTNVDIIEMVCDWYAMSQEFNSSIDDWATDVIPRRYHFGKRINLVMDTIAKMKELDA